MEAGKLYICPTPIGNLEDITLRTLRILGEVDIIAAEDTRHTIKLLNHYEIKKPLTSYHEHNIREKGLEVIEKLRQGLHIALVSDAGMPGISDPGQDLISMAIDDGIEVVALPGATASITALVVSGFNTDKFVFEGFLSSRKKNRVQELNNLREEKRTIIIYESPHRLLSALNDMLEVVGNRRIALARELTKRYEEVFRGHIDGAIDYYSKSQIRGEFVIILEGNMDKEKEVEIDIQEELKILMDSGMSKKDSVKKISEDRNIPRNEVYKESLKI